MERKNKASLLSKIRFAKGRFSAKSEAWACRFFLGIYLCEKDEKDDLVKSYFLGIIKII
jgi:hypothetical protein